MNETPLYNNQLKDEMFGNNDTIGDIEGVLNGNSFKQEIEGIEYELNPNEYIFDPKKIWQSFAIFHNDLPEKVFQSFNYIVSKESIEALFYQATNDYYYHSQKKVLIASSELAEQISIKYELEKIKPLEALKKFGIDYLCQATEKMIVYLD